MSTCRTLFFITIKCYVHWNSAGLCTADAEKLERYFYVSCHWQLGQK